MEIMASGRRWPCTWFGFWREDEDGSEGCPSVFDWVVTNWRDHVDVDRVVGYLEASPCVIATSADACVICRNIIRRSLAYRTDGVWYWPDTLAHYITQHGVRLPEEFLTRLLAAEHIAPKEEDLWKDEREFIAVLRRLSAPAEHLAMLRHLAENR
jgi:hypothetical protein